MISMSARRRRWLGYATLTGLGLFIAFSPFFLLTSAYRLDVGRLALYVAILAATWSLLAGVAGQFSFAHVTIAGAGAYGSVIWEREVSGSLGSIYVGVAVGSFVALVVGTLLGVLLLRLRGAYLALFTLAFAEIARVAVVSETELTGGRLGLGVNQLPGNELLFHFVLFGLLVGIVALIYLVLHSRTGLFLRAMREDAEAAAAMGVNLIRLKVLVFSVTSLMIGFAAAVFVHTTPRVSPERLDLLFMSQVVAVAVIGGIESPLAAAIGALVMFWTLEVLRGINIGSATLDVITALFALALVGLVASVLRMLANSRPRHLPSRFLSPLPHLAASALLLSVFVFAVASADGVLAWLVWTSGGIGCVAIATFISRSSQHWLPEWLRRLYVRLLFIVIGAIVLGRLMTATELDVELGVWRFAVFGAVLMLTLRFARNGLVYPFLVYFSGRREAMGATIAGREVASSALPRLTIGR